MCLSAHRKFPFGSADPAIREQAVIHMEKRSQFRLQIGYLRLIQLAGMTFTTSQPIKWLYQRSRWRKSKLSCTKAGGKWVQCLLWKSWIPITWTLWVSSNAESKNSNVVHGVSGWGNISAGNYDIVTDGKLSKPHITQIHLKDTYRKWLTSAAVLHSKYQMRSWLRPLFLETCWKTDMLYHLVIEMGGLKMKCWKDSHSSRIKTFEWCLKVNGCSLRLFDHQL